MRFHGQETITSGELILFCIDILKRVGDSITALVSFNSFCDAQLADSESVGISHQLSGNKE